MSFDYRSLVDLTPNRNLWEDLTSEEIGYTNEPHWNVPVVKLQRG